MPTVLGFLVQYLKGNGTALCILRRKLSDGCNRLHNSVSQSSWPGWCTHSYYDDRMIAEVLDSVEINVLGCLSIGRLGVRYLPEQEFASTSYPEVRAILSSGVPRGRLGRLAPGGTFKGGVTARKGSGKNGKNNAKWRKKHSNSR